MNPVMSRWLQLGAFKPPSSPEPEPVNVTKGTDVQDTASVERQERYTSLPSTPVKRLTPGHTSQELDLTQQYEIIQTLLRAALSRWSVLASSQSEDLYTDRRGRQLAPGVCVPLTQTDPQEVYLVSKYWWDWFHKTSSNSMDIAARDSGVQYTMGPVDNRTLVLDTSGDGAKRSRGFYKLRNDKLSGTNKPYEMVLQDGCTVIGNEYCICVPREVWESCLVEW